MHIDGLTIERTGGVLLVSIEEPPEADESDVDGELVFVPDDDYGDD